MHTLLPTSIVGSLPKPSWLAEPETLWSPWKLQGDALVEGTQDALRIAVQEQRQAGIDIISDGEQTRQHFVTTFIEHLSGVDFDQRETVRIRRPVRRQRADGRRRREPREARVRRRREVPPPADRSAHQVGTAWADDDDRHPLTIATTRAARSWPGVRDDPQSRGEGARGGRGGHHPVRRAGVQRLLRTTCRTGAWQCSRGRPRDCARRPSCTSATATGSRRTRTGRRLSLGMAAVREVVPAAAAVQHRHRLAGEPPLARPAGPDRAHPGKKVMLGAIDVASHTIETPEEVADTLRNALRFVDADKLIPSTNLRLGAVVT